MAYAWQKYSRVLSGVTMMTVFVVTGGKELGLARQFIHCQALPMAAARVAQPVRRRIRWAAQPLAGCALEEVGAHALARITVASSLSTTLDQVRHQSAGFLRSRRHHQCCQRSCGTSCSPVPWAIKPTPHNLLTCAQPAGRPERRTTACPADRRVRCSRHPAKSRSTRTCT